eukprot:CCRYP_000581-RD/>CCRYP_000581-RD protein AED:0.11 eAED:0.11 QI:1527/0.5/0.66/1/0/0/3/0/331
MPSFKKIIVGAAFVAVSGIIAVVLWRYGPWLNSSTEPTSDGNVSSKNLFTNSTCQTCCNGLESNCDLPVNQVLFPAVHNAHSSYEDNFIGASNNLPFEEALIAGYRAIQLTSCACEGGVLLSNYLLEQDEEWGLADSNLGFCNSYCGKGVRDPKEVLTTIKSFLDSNRREVMIIYFSVEEDSLNDLRIALQHSGLEKFVYRPNEKYVDWPTMQSLIESDTRLLLFANGEASVSGDNLAEFFVMNHYETNKINWPSESNARELNSFSVLQKRLHGCKGRKLPSIIAVDFWDVGDVVEFVMEENKRRGGIESTLDQDFGFNMTKVEKSGNVRG